MTDSSDLEKISGDMQAGAAPDVSSSDDPKPVSVPTARYDWYQTDSHVVVTILAKGVKKDDLHVDIQDTSINASLRLPSGADFQLMRNLQHDVNPSASSIKIMSTKIEIKLKKVEGLQWTKLERDETVQEVKHFKPESSSDDIHKYPSSAHVTRDWDKVVAEIKIAEKDEKLEGDAALNQLFQQIYSDGSDEVRKAMNKSFSESGGTVLSTNWNEVAEKKVDVKPPDGMEYKNWSG